MGVCHRINSLKGKKNFEELNHNGKKFSLKEAQLIFLKKAVIRETGKNKSNGAAPLSPEIKIGIPTGRKIGNAVIRNKAKRRIRAICRELLQEVDAGYLIIIKPNTGFRYLSYAESKEIVRLLFRNAGILRS